MADLEREVENAPDTIFEAGSVSKQFTAAAVLLLARDGKLSIDDPVRKYVPELPDYGVPLTIRHMLTHTSGLRDWGSVAGIAGWPRTTRVHTHGHVLDIVSRQKALNFTPGTNWSYSNSGYNLSAIIVSRVSGQSFADFSRDRIFKPLGMTRTSWRDDFKRIVNHRALAYERERGRLSGGHAVRERPRQRRPADDRGGFAASWNENFVTPVVGDAAFVAQQQITGAAQRRPRSGLRVRTLRPSVSRRAGSQLTAARLPAIRRTSRASRISTCRWRCCATPRTRSRRSMRAPSRSCISARRWDRPPRQPPAGPAAVAGVARKQPKPFSPLQRIWPRTPDGIRAMRPKRNSRSPLDGGALVLKQRPDTVRRMRATGKDVFAVPVVGTVTFLARLDRERDRAERQAQDRVWDLRFQRQRSLGSKLRKCRPESWHSFRSDRGRKGPTAELEELEMSRVHTKSSVIAALLALSVAVASAQTPVQAPKNKYSPADDVKLGREAAAEVQKELPVMRDERVNRVPERHRPPAGRTPSRPSSGIPSSATPSPA